MRTTPDPSSGIHRGQMVVALAVVVTIALVPIAAAYLQLGYAPTAQTSAADDASAVDRALVQAVGGAENEVAGEYPWSERTDAVDNLRDELDPRFEGIESPGRHEPVAVTVTYNQTLAVDIASTDCPSGSGRQFGPCRAYRGVVVQERAGETVVVAVALDARVVRPESRTVFARAYRP